MRRTLGISGSFKQAISGALRRRTHVASQAVASAWRKAVWMSSLSYRAKRRYSDAIVPYKTRPGAYLRDKVAQLLESGWKPFDMRPGLLKGRLHRPVPLLTDGGTTQIRTVSHASPHGSWRHPGFKGAQIMKKMKGQFDRLIAEALSGE